MIALRTLSVLCAALVLAACGRPDYHSTIDRDGLSTLARDLNRLERTGWSDGAALQNACATVSGWSGERLARASIDGSDLASAAVILLGEPGTETAGLDLLAESCELPSYVGPRLALAAARQHGTTPEGDTWALVALDRLFSDRVRRSCSGAVLIDAARSCATYGWEGACSLLLERLSEDPVPKRTVRGCDADSRAIAIHTSRLIVDRPVVSAAPGDCLSLDRRATGLWVELEVGGRTIDALLDTGAEISQLPAEVGTIDGPRLPIDAWGTRRERAVLDPLEAAMGPIAIESWRPIALDEGDVPCIGRDIFHAVDAFTVSATDEELCVSSAVAGPRAIEISLLPAPSAYVVPSRLGGVIAPTLLDSGNAAASVWGVAEPVAMDASCMRVPRVTLYGGDVWLEICQTESLGDTWLVGATPRTAFPADGGLGWVVRNGEHLLGETEDANIGLATLSSCEAITFDNVGRRTLWYGCP